MQERWLWRVVLPVAACVLGTPAAWPTVNLQNATVRVSGCVIDGRYFAPLKADVTVWMPDTGARMRLRSDGSGRFAFNAPPNTRLILTVAPQPDATSQTLHMSTERKDTSTGGCLVLW